MKVCIISMTGSWGGLEIHTVNLIRELVSEGHEVELVEIGKGIYEKAILAIGNVVRLTRLETEDLNPRLNFIDSLRIVLSHKAEILLLPKGSLDTGNWKMDILARFLFKKFICIEHLKCEPMPEKESRFHFYGIIPGLGLWWYRIYLGRCLRALGPHKVICVSDSVRRGLEESYGFPTHKLRTIHNGIDTDTFKPSRERRTTTRASWGIADNALVFGSIGRLTSQKGYEDSIKLFRKLTDLMPNREVSYVIVGEGIPREHEKLQTLIRDYQLSGKVFLHDFTDRPCEMYPAFDVFLMPSRNEGLPIALLEAMASGCCPIAMGVGGIPEVIFDKSVGWLVPPGDCDGFAEAMLEAACSAPAELTKKGTSAREHVITNFNAKSQYPAIVRFLKEQLEPK